MKLLLLKIKEIAYYLIGIEWIVSSACEDCCPVPVYIVEEE
jgi:hypothetical protein